MNNLNYFCNKYSNFMYIPIFKVNDISRHFVFRLILCRHFV